MWADTIKQSCQSTPELPEPVPEVEVRAQLLRSQLGKLQHDVLDKVGRQGTSPLKRQASATPWLCCPAFPLAFKDVNVGRLRFFLNAKEGIDMLSDTTSLIWIWSL